MTQVGAGQILELQVVGGFLDGIKMTFTPGLNCIIGSRGAGKTSVLEFIRYALDALPESEQSSLELKRINKLIESNLGGGTIRVRFIGQDGCTYVVSRATGEAPVVQTVEGDPTFVSLGTLIRLHAHSQSDVEAIADDAGAQLDLIDRFESEKLQHITNRLRELRNSLRTNASRILEVRGKLAGLEDQLGVLDGIEEKLSRLRPVTDDKGKEVQRSSDAKALRQREAQVVTNASPAFTEINRRASELTAPLKELLAELARKELREGPNGSTVREIHERLQALREELESQTRQIRERIDREEIWLAQSRTKLSRQHQEQDQQYRALLEKHREMQGPARERAQLETQRQLLLAVKGEKDALGLQLDGLEQERASLVSEVADLQATRYGLRDQVVKRINADLDDQVRVGLENLGDQEDYRKLLEERLRKVGIKSGVGAQKLMSLSPAELVELLKARDVAGISDRAGLNAQQAAKVLPILAEPETILALEAVALRDKPRIELNDQGNFKATADLSKGQKCTAVLPVLLMDGHRPLLIDQPEDNLDNRFICRVIVDKIRKVKPIRQIIFATHNPNVVVLGAADRVNVLESDGKRSQLLRSGSVEERKGDILALLEGGAEAFELRRIHYGN